MTNLESWVAILTGLGLSIPLSRTRFIKAPCDRIRAYFAERRWRKAALETTLTQIRLNTDAIYSAIKPQPVDCLKDFFHAAARACKKIEGPQLIDPFVADLLNLFTKASALCTSGSYAPLHELLTGQKPPLSSRARLQEILGLLEQIANEDPKKRAMITLIQSMLLGEPIVEPTAYTRPGTAPYVPLALTEITQEQADETARAKKKRSHRKKLDSGNLRK